MNRRTAYFGVLKFQFHYNVVRGVKCRAAYADAKRKAAEYVFNASTEKLITWIAVW